MNTIKLDHKLKRVQVKEFEVENDIVFNYFDKLSADKRDELFLRAIYIGVLALMEDRISSFLAKTANELGTELESLKLIFDMKKELFFKSSTKGIIAEEEIADFLNQFFHRHGLDDKATLTGNSSGLLPKNKTGDIVCYLNAERSLKIVLECKFDKSIRLGDIETKDIFTKKSDTAWSQLIEAQANREGQIAIIVLDASVIDAALLNAIENVRYIPAVGFVAIVDSQKGDYGNLSIAYMLARDIAINSHAIELDKDLLAAIINRIIKDIGEILSIKELVTTNIEINRQILTKLEKVSLLMDFNQKYLMKFLQDGTLSKLDFLSFYSGDEIKEKYKLIEKEIKSL